MSNLKELKNTVQNPLLLLKEIKNSGVEFKKLGEVAEKITSGATPKEFAESGINFIKVEAVTLSGLNKEKLSYVTEEIHDTLLKKSILQENDILFCIAGSIGKTLLVTKDMLPANTNQALAIIRVKENVNPNYVKYYLSSCYMKQYLLSQVTGPAQPNLNLTKLRNFEVPIPPLEVQEEIVRILDPLTKNVNELIDLLKREQELRKKQYSYYLDKLLTFEEDIPKVKLGEICERIKNINWKQENNTSKKYIDLSSVSRELHIIIDDEVKDINCDNAPSRAKQIIKTNDILFGTTRPMLKRFCIVPEKYDDQICSTGFCVLRIINNDVLVNYIYHCLSTSNFYNFVKDNEQGTTYPAISDNMLKEYKIPLPPIDTQKRIVDILDNFDQYCNNLQKGLPAEIEKRKKQYAYYRDELLRFERK